MFLTAYCLALFITAQSPETPIELQMDDYWYVNSETRFDVSGLVAITPELRAAFGFKGDILLIHDWKPMVYEGTFRGHEIDLQPWADLKLGGAEDNCDLEGIDAYEGKIYVANEFPPIVYVIEASPELKISKIDFSNLISKAPEEYKLTSTFGIEALGATADALFLAKEMSPLTFFKFDRKDPLHSKLELVPRNQSGSQTGLKIHEPWFYVLNRESREILKSKPPFTRQQSFSFKQTLLDPRFDYPVKDSKGVIHDEWSTAEALDVLEKHIWVGLDNNGEFLRSGTERRGAVISFKRPKDF